MAHPIHAGGAFSRTFLLYPRFRAIVRPVALVWHRVGFACPERLQQARVGCSRAGRKELSTGLGGEVLGDFFPVIDANETGRGQVVRSTVKEALAFKAEQILGQVVDQVVGAEDGLVAAKDVVGGRDEGKMTLEPAVLGAQ